MTLTLEPPVGSVRSGRLARARRALLVTTLLSLGALALFVLSMMIGSYRLNPVEVVGSVTHLRDDPAADFIVRNLRLPSAVTALGAGIALGAAGTVFQRLLGNPLASPDFVGISSGASLFAVAAIVLFAASSATITGAALGGALLSAAVVYVFAWRGGVSGYRFVLVGIGVSEFMLSLVGYIVARADLFEARKAYTWLVGSVGQAGPGERRILLVTVLVLLPVAVLLDRHLRTLELGDDTARALGAPVEGYRLALLAIAIVLVAVATAAAGPIMFVALVAGPIARRLLGPGAGDVLAAAAIGAMVLLAADLVAIHALPTALPTGVVTGAVGAPYLIWLLVTANRDNRGH